MQGEKNNLEQFLRSQKEQQLAAETKLRAVEKNYRDLKKYAIVGGWRALLVKKLHHVIVSFDKLLLTYFLDTKKAYEDSYFVLMMKIA